MKRPKTPQNQQNALRPETTVPHSGTDQHATSPALWMVAKSCTSWDSYWEHFQTLSIMGLLYRILPYFAHQLLQDF